MSAGGASLGIRRTARGKQLRHRRAPSFVASLHHVQAYREDGSLTRIVRCIRRPIPITLRCLATVYPKVLFAVNTSKK